MPKSLDAKKKHYNLDTVLKLVHITNTVKIDWDLTSLQTTEARDAAEKWDCAGNTDLYMVFHWLKNSANVQKVLQVTVEDSGKGKDWRPHSDKAIVECLKDLDIETWAWKRDDIPSDVIVDSCGNHVKTLYLWCSGLKAVLQSWSEERGLARLKAVGVLQRAEFPANSPLATERLCEDKPSLPALAF